MSTHLGMARNSFSAGMGSISKLTCFQLDSFYSKTALCTVFSVSVKSNSVLPVAQGKNPHMAVFLV